MNRTILVTGGAGFIGSAVIRHLLASSDYTVVNIDKMTYAANPLTLTDFNGNEKYHFEKADIADKSAMQAIFDKYQPQGIMHLAAESHVDRSIDAAGDFIQANIIGTFVLLEAARKYFLGLADEDKASFMFHHISTDEVFGSLSDEDNMFTETTRYKPNSPYSASKAASDHLVRSWYKTYGLPIVMSNCSNNYGPYQFPEKLIPLIIQRALDEKALPIYGNGLNIRDWLYVDDHAKALCLIFMNGKLGESYNVGGHNEIRNIDVVTHICALLNEMRPRQDGASYVDQIEYVKDRPGHDYRYAIDSSKIQKELGWTPDETFETGIRKTVQWYLDNNAWCEEAAKCYQGDRQGGSV